MYYVCAHMHTYGYMLHAGALLWPGPDPAAVTPLGKSSRWGLFFHQGPEGPEEQLLSAQPRQGAHGAAAALASVSERSLTAPAAVVRRTCCKTFSLSYFLVVFLSD